ncbi:hypothetical protein [Hymenobacter sp. BT491]|uniref:hypothetical protein n=1 Tax=Hymenobacter sp. BT491 TaxID=2766779 RepID=UPI001653EA48|nr:hypothetical protein [Hymenobacter sp. BT491]MBC6992019.1 hypothetical protein [Hymenobacter sp. BT491]
MKGFKVYPIDTVTGPVPAHSRRDFHTIYLLTGPRQLQCADQVIERNGTCLFFGTPYSITATPQIGYGCLFSEAFVQESGRTRIQEEWALFHNHPTRAFSLRDEQAVYLTSLFQKMLVEQHTAYRFKHELLRSYLQLVFHEAVRLRTPVPKRCFRYYFRQPGPAGELEIGRGRQRRSV